MRKLIIGIVVISIASMAAADGKLTNVQWSKAGRGLKVQLKGTNLARPTIIRANGGRSFMLQFDAEFVGKARKESVNYAGVKFIQSGWYSAEPARTRVHLMLDDPLTPVQFDRVNGDWLISVNTAAPVAKTPRAKLTSAIGAGAGLLASIDDTILIKRPPLADLQAQSQAAPSRIKLAFTNTSVAYVLKAISLQTGANIVLASQSDVKITMNLTANGAEDAIRATTASSGLAYAKAGSTYVVAAPAELRNALAPYGVTQTFPVAPGSEVAMLARLQETYPLGTFRLDGSNVVMIAQPAQLREAKGLIAAYSIEIETNKPVSEVVLLSRASASEVEKMLATVFPSLKLASSGGADGKFGGSVAITGPRREVLEAKNLASQLDVEATGGGGSTVFEVYALKYTSAPSVAEFLKKAAPEVEAIAGPESFSPERGLFQPLGSALKSASGSGGSNGGTNNQTQNQSSPQGGQGTQTKEKPGDRATVVVLKGPKRAVDAALKLVASLDVKPIQVMVDVKVIETSPNFTENLGINFSWTALQFFESPAGSSFPPNLTKPTGVGQFSRVPWSFQGLMNALITKGEAKVLANPSVRVISNNDANVFIGDTIRARISQANGLGGQTVDVVEFPVGIILLIRPRVNADGNITMHVNPVVSTITAIGSDNIPQTSSREAETTVMVKDGETIVIGGLIRDEYSKIVQEVPILARLPIIGELFKNRSTNRRYTEVVVTITPHIVKETGGKGH